MQTVKAVYKQGAVHLLTPLQDVEEAELLVIVLDKNEFIAKKNTIYTDFSNPEQDFELLGLAHFFATEDNSDINWEAIEETEKLSLTRLQEQSGFVQTVLASPLEDVWNEL